MDIQITQRHIDQGRQHSYQDCAVAQAFREKGHHNVLVGIQERSPWGIGHRRLAKVDGQTFVLDEKATEFVNNFDRDKRLVAPTTLTLSPYFPERAGLEDAYHYHAMAMKPKMQPFVMSEGTIDEMAVTATSVMMGYNKGYPKYQYGVDYGPMPKMSMYTT